jgi:hypothetical protein
MYVYILNAIYICHYSTYLLGDFWSGHSTKAQYVWYMYLTNVFLPYLQLIFQSHGALEEGHLGNANGNLLVYIYPWLNEWPMQSLNS